MASRHSGVAGDTRTNADFWQCDALLGAQAIGGLRDGIEQYSGASAHWLVADFCPDCRGTFVADVRIKLPEWLV
jgi:hypothetical protein